MPAYTVTGTKALPSQYDITNQMLALPNYGAPNVAPVGYTATGGLQTNLFNGTGSALPMLSPNPSAAPEMGLQESPLAPASDPIKQGFTTINPLTGKTNMVAYTPGSGAGVFNQVINDPTRLGSLFGKAGASTALKATLPSPVPGVVGAGGAGGAGMPIGGPGGANMGGDPSAITGPGGVNPTPGPNPLPGVDPSGQLPSYILNQFGSNLAGALRGELPEDVQNLLAQQSAEYGVGSGTQGSQFQGYRGLRNLGLTSLDRMKDAEALVADQFTKPAEKIALDQKAKELADLQARADRAFGLEKQKLEADLKLEKDKFAAYQNDLNRKYELDSLASLEGLGLKYGGKSVGGGGGFTGLTGYTPVGQRPSFNPSTGITTYS